MGVLWNLWVGEGNNQCVSEKFVRNSGVWGVKRDIRSCEKFPRVGIQSGPATPRALSATGTHSHLESESHRRTSSSQDRLLSPDYVTKPPTSRARRAGHRLLVDLQLLVNRSTVHLPLARVSFGIELFGKETQRFLSPALFSLCCHGYSRCGIGISHLYLSTW